MATLEVPAGHSSQELWPGWAAKAPPEHREHNDDPAEGAKRPAAHGPHGVVAPVAGWNAPDAHRLHSPCAASATEPAAHGVHTVAPTPLTLPPAHFTQVLLTANVPDEQGVHDSPSMPTEPEGHGVHADAPTGLDDPGAQGEHTDGSPRWALSGFKALKVLAGQAMQSHSSCEPM